MKLVVFSSLRRIKAYYEEFKDKDVLLDHALSIQEFEEKLLVSTFQRASVYQSLLLMAKACKDTKKLESELKIPSNFFAFLRNNEYIFSFFKELIVAKKRPRDLTSFDLYAQYDEHLLILDELFTRYFDLLKDSNLSDDLSLYLDYDLNDAFLDAFDEIWLYQDGFLNDFEINLFKKLALEKELKIVVETSVFNLEFLINSPLFELFELEADYLYTLSISKQTVEDKKPLKRNKDVCFKSLSSSFLQAGFVYANLQDYLNKGIDPSKIAVITPDESFADILRAYDKDGLLSFARGISIKSSSFYLRLKALLDNLKADFQKSSAKEYLKESCLELCNTKLEVYKLHESFKTLFLDKPCPFKDFSKLVTTFLNDEENLELKELINLELLFLQKLLQDSLTLRELLELFFIQISKLFISEVRGAKTRVLGLLESRGLKFDALIIVDFNDDLIPKRVASELFLNNALRKKAGLISYNDRENLQRHYYLSLISAAKHTSLCYVENEEKIPSRFLQECSLNLLSYDKYSEKDLARYFTKTTPVKLQKEVAKDFEVEHLPKDALSFSRLKLFLDSKMDYYYQYILKIPSPKELSSELDLARFGTLIHSLLEDAFKNKAVFKLEPFLQSLDKSCLDPLDKEVLAFKFKEFVRSEETHYEKGFVLKATEQLLEAQVTLKSGEKLTLKGIIDRIDASPDYVMIIDYKTGSIPKKPDQLNFYRLLYYLSFEKDPSEIKAMFYDLKDSMHLVGVKKSDDFTKLLEDLELFASTKALELSPASDTPSTFKEYKTIYKKELK